MKAVNEVIILAGGLGTRLRSVVDDRPKAMADINGRPFLEILLDKCIEEGMEKAVLSVGFKGEMINDYFGPQYKSLAIKYAHEKEPLGTGGAIRFAFEQISGKRAFVLNGDSILDFSFSSMARQHYESNAQITISVKHMLNPHRYGTIESDEHHRIFSFKEKEKIKSGYINCGIYLMDKSVLAGFSLGEKFSIEQDFLTPKIKELSIYSYSADGYFIDIGIPEDYERACAELRPFQITKDWTLFLDRDGVINERLVGDYVKRIEDFTFLPAVLEAISTVSSLFGRIVVVTNQQGIGKGLMSEEDLQSIHQHMTDSIQKAGGKIDAVYHAPQLAQENSEMRKPNTGMGLKAKAEFPEIDFSKSIMVGDSASDMVFGKALEMKTVIVGDKRPKDLEHIDLWYPSLHDFSMSLA